MDASTTDALALFGLDEPICPYTGLRTFTEEEAIYFRGRETHVAKCLALLAEQRFVMITGASGDGKSSLVFAGMLPEVRAGFVRARYSSWAVATFRPERSPLHNLARALATALRLPSAGAVETELEHGFSALVELYKTSVLCPASLPPGLSPAEERRHQRGAANLLLVVDQFEEFFTNPENYDGDTPNPAAQTVVNLLLETTRLARVEGLPIYIVCTMRSDFVGQCAEFRGLIEQVGASQYFVPRLVRHEFVEVIREPALLSGNRISERLVQRLLYDIGHGQDQLPVLQHALRRIWLAANEGREEMDLLHYAMVGGLNDELPAADQARFAAWRAALPAQQQAFLLASPSLHNVLDAHANQLFAEANELYNRDFTPPLPPGTAERVIEQTFRVLTRTDGKRVVRNRLTGAQITAIIDDESLPWPVVCRILRPFRAPGATFLSPFLNEDEDDRAVLPPDTVLDITHESLIRNWQHLAQWASAEAADVRIAESFVQQADRWQANGESAGFVLPIGLYTFFEQWHRAKKGAASWLAYYLEPGPDTALRQEHAATQNATLTRFLKASRRRLWFSLLVARYGAGRLAGAVSAAVLIVVLAWVACLYRQQQTDYVAYRIVQQCLTPQDSGNDSTSALQSPYVAVEDKGHFLLNTDRLKDLIYQPVFGGRPASEYAFPRVLSALKNDTLALDIELSMYACANNMDRDSIERENPYIQPILRDLVLRLDSAGRRRLPRVASRAGAPSEKQRREAVLRARTIMALSYYLACDQQHRTAAPPDTAQRAATRQYFAEKRKQLLRQLRSYLWREINTTTGPAPRPVAVGFCLRVLLGQGTDSSAELAFLDGLSPFGPPAARQQFERFFPLSPTPYAGTSKATHSGGYLTAAMLFAARRQPALVRQCLDSMSRLRPRIIDVNSGIALLPYLVKYRLLKPATVRPLLESCAQVGGFSFNEMYAATVYSLLSVKPVPAIFEESLPTGPGDISKQGSTRLGGFDPGTQNADRVSFALPVATRDSAWAALQAATPGIAHNQTIFIESEEHDLANGIKEEYYDQRNELFLTAFLAKMHGVYLAEIKRRPSEAAQSFATFSSKLTALQKHLQNRQAPRNVAPQIRRNAHQLNTLQWNLGVPQQLPPTTGTTRYSTGAQDPITFLRLPTRPKTLAFETYYTCSFNTFFHYELQHEARAKKPDPAVVQLLDSVAFVEAALPDRLSTTRVNSLFAEALARPKRHLPNLAWIRAVARTRVSLPNDSLRRQRNGLLLKIEEALRDHDQLNDTLAISRLIQVAGQDSGPADFSTIPLKVAFSDLAAAVAHEGRMKQAFALADTLGEPMTTITKIRAGEQAMLTNNRSDEAQMALLTFLQQYLFDKAGTIDARFIGRHVGKPQPVAGSIIPLFYWQPFTVDLLHWFVPDAGRILNNQLSAGEVTTDAGLYAICKGHSLADEGSKALEQIPAYEPAHFRQIDYNYILLGIAHLNDRRNSPSLRAHDRNGWREYDEAELTLPADYDGPVE
ncbi:hypothetical protein GCM10022409_22960 [Hymenobacter glaciei]|uniref:Novel STAND NTPase 1 domain-containing protein n=1 Tax=Hymenobacter glaciei TaxID=877209 RepID=A0ABP7U7H5_9BACT